MPSADYRPRFLFFRSVPPDLSARHPLASSFQNFESCLLLVALQRYPHAFTACVLAIESALKSAFGYSPEERSTLWALMREARDRSDVLRRFPLVSLNEIRDTRNRFVHYGFASSDDELSAALLLQAAFPFLCATYKELLSFSLDDGLLPEFAEPLNVISRLFSTNAGSDSAQPIAVALLNAFGHLVRWSLKDSMSSHWELDALERSEQNFGKYELVDARKRKLEMQLEPSWSFDCPVCQGIHTFVCELDDTALNEGHVMLARGFCADCEFAASSKAPGLAHALCSEQVSESSYKILQEYGVGS